MISSIPFDPNLTGTPTYRPSMPYCPSRYAVQGRISFLSNQKNIIRLALLSKKEEVEALWEGVSLRQYKLPIE